MPNLTPIPLTEEEHQKVTSLKHKVEASSWRDMLMKLCTIYEEYCQLKSDVPLAKDGITTESPALKQYVEEIVDQRLEERQAEEKQIPNSEKKIVIKKGNPGEVIDVDEETVRRIFKEEIANYKMQLPKCVTNHLEEHEKQKNTAKCLECGEQIPKDSEECPECGVDEPFEPNILEL